MNAPWKTGNRDMFAAFVCDDVTLDTLRSVVIDMGWPPEKVMKGGLRNAIQSLAITASPAILMVDLSESGDPLNDINALAEVCEPGTVVIAVGQVNDVRLYRDLVASGIQDYLLKPLSVGHLRDTLVQAQAIFAAPRGDGAATKRHIATAVVGTRGGVGASTVATSLAWMLSADHKMPTALLDLDVHFGTGALTLSGTMNLGTTTRTLTVSNAQVRDAGNYQLIARYQGGASTSQVAALHVTGVAAWGDNSSGCTDTPPGATNCLTSFRRKSGCTNSGYCS